MNVPVVFLLHGGVGPRDKFAILHDKNIRLQPIRVHGNFYCIYLIGLQL